MENASKALMIAAEVLIGIMVLGLLVVVATMFANFSRNMNKKIAADEVLIYNNHYTQFNGRVDITAQEIATTINFAKKNNDNYEISRTNTENSNFYTTVFIKNDNFFNNSSYIRNNIMYNNWISFNNTVRDFVKANNMKLYSCNVQNVTPNPGDSKKIRTTRKPLGSDITLNNETGRVEKIIFIETNISGLTVETRNEYEINVN